MTNPDRAQLAALADLPTHPADWPEEWLYNVRERHAIMREDPTADDAEHRRRAIETTRAEYRRIYEEEP